MLFPTAQFGIFFIVVFLVSWRLRPNRRAWMAFTLAASYVFYGWWDWRFVFLIAASTLFNQLLGTAIFRTHDDARRKLLMGLAVGGNLVVLGFFKYYEFFVVSVTNGLAKLGLGADPPLLRILLPIGISFFTFQAISYVVDIYRRDLEPATPIEFGMYLSFFPHLVAGPIVRASEFVPQLRRRPDEHRIRLHFLDEAGNTVGLYTSDYQSTATWTERSTTRLAPSGTRTLRIELNCRTNTGTLCHAYFDALTLHASYP